MLCALASPFSESKLSAIFWADSSDLALVNRSNMLDLVCVLLEMIRVRCERGN